MVATHIPTVDKTAIVKCEVVFMADGFPRPLQPLGSEFRIRSVLLSDCDPASLSEQAFEGGNVA
jgi:hypothetical protein